MATIEDDYEVGFQEGFHLGRSTPSDNVTSRVNGILTEVERIYPEDIWRTPTFDEYKALHRFCIDTLGWEDGSPFHVAGVRHAIRTMRKLADDAT